MLFICFSAARLFFYSSVFQNSKFLFNIILFFKFLPVCYYFFCVVCFLLFIAFKISSWYCLLSKSLLVIHQFLCIFLLFICFVVHLSVSDFFPYYYCLFSKSLPITFISVKSLPVGYSIFPIIFSLSFF